ncbi:hypothetical protein G6F65_022547 [Rhizopus arrhizus]|nr:hypothetical protein G6F65_022547 [Rhizopus arrhizus]
MQILRAPRAPGWHGLAARWLRFAQARTERKLARDRRQMIPSHDATPSTALPRLAGWPACRYRRSRPGPSAGCPPARIGGAGLVHAGRQSACANGLPDRTVSGVRAGQRIGRRTQQCAGPAR